MKIDKSLIVPIDNLKVPASVAALRPTLFKDGNSYCTILGPDPSIGIFGCGNTPEAALADWDKHLKECLEQPANNDPVAKYAKEKLESAKHIL